MRAQTGLVAATLAASLAGCAGNGKDSGGGSEKEPQAVEVMVQNNNWSDMNVYLERDGIRTRLGTVTTATTRVFRVPRSLASLGGTVRLVADPIGGRAAYITTPVLIAPGQRVEFTIQNYVNISSVAVWN